MKTLLQIIPKFCDDRIHFTKYINPISVSWGPIRKSAMYRQTYFIFLDYNIFNNKTTKKSKTTE